MLSFIILIAIYAINPIKNIIVDIHNNKIDFKDITIISLLVICIYLKSINF